MNMSTSYHLIPNKKWLKELTKPSVATVPPTMAKMLMTRL